MIIQGNNPFIGASFSLRNRIKRQFWNIIWMFLFYPSPRLCSAWRNFLLRKFGAKIGHKVHIQSNVRVWAPWNLEIANYVGIGDRVIIYSMAKIIIGDYAVISQGTHLCAGTHDYNSANFQLYALPITIGPRAWLCADTFVGPGAEIPEGSVIASRGVVVNILPEPWLVWGGVPVKKISTRTRR